MKLASLDVETGGYLPEYQLQAHRARTGEAWLTCWSTAGEFVNGGYRPPVADLRAFLLACAKDKVTITGWNTQFDCSWMIALGLREEVMACRWLDGMLLYKHATNWPEGSPDLPKSRRLKDTVKLFYPEVGDYGADIDFQEPDPATPEWGEWVHKLTIYNRMDAELALRLTEKFWAMLTREQRVAALIEAAAIPMAAETAVEGLAVDTSGAASLYHTLEVASDAALDRLMAGDDKVKPEVLASPQQLAKLLFEDWGLPQTKQTPGGSASTDKEVLARLALADPRAADVYTYREARNNRTKFPGSILANSTYYQRPVSYPGMRLFGTYTGRMTYSSKQGKGVHEIQTGLPLHQWKRDPEFRKLIRAPDGYTLLEFDFAGQEFRWMAVYSGDETMLGLCAPGEDAHAFMGSRVGGMSYDELRAKLRAEEAEAKRYRQFGKVANLSCIAGGQRVLTNKGYVPIEEVAVSDKLWDGVEWVDHAGVVYQGVKETMAYGGIRATGDHRVLVGGQWATLSKAAAHGWTIEPALGAGPGSKGAAVRFLDGLELNPDRQGRSDLRASDVRVRHGERGEPAHDGGWPVDEMQGLCDPGATRESRALPRTVLGGTACTEARQRHASALQQSERPILQELRRARHSVLVSDNQSSRELRAGGATAPDVLEAGHRQDRQRRALRTGEPAIGDPQEEPSQPEAVYDILNAGPRNRFVVEGRVVSNCQYRTGAQRLAIVSEVQHRLPMTLGEARAIHGTYQRTYRAVPLYWKRQQMEARTELRVSTMAGRVINIHYNGTSDGQWMGDSTAINFPIQGTGADQKYLAMLVLRDYLPSVEGRFYFELHDGLFVVVPDRYREKAARDIKQLLSNLPYKRAWGVDLPVQFPVDAKLGKSWGELKEWSE